MTMLLRSAAVAAFLLVNSSVLCNAFIAQHGSSGNVGVKQSGDIGDYGYPKAAAAGQCCSMVSTSSNSETAKKNTKQQKLEIKYPTARGTTVDSRKIVASGLARQHLRAVRLKHILFASEELAEISLSRVRSSELSFEELATQISNCAETREDGGEVGWVNIDGFFTNNNNDSDGNIIADTNEHLDAILPEQARFQTFQLSTKPGDIIMATSHRGYHLVQIVDVMVDVRKMAQRKTRNKMQGIDAKKGKKKPVPDAEQKTPLRGILGGALLHSSDDDDDDDDAIGIGKKKNNLTYKMETMGCQMNMADSERMEGQLQSLGLTPVMEDDKDTQPDLVVLNTCSIRDHAEQKVYSYIGPYAKRKREGEDVAIIVAGCVAQQEGQNLLRRAPEVDLVMGPQYANRLADLLEDVSNGNQVVATEASHIMEDSTKPRRTSTVAAWVNVIYGCNERCTFCIVPTTRGVEQSRPIQSIVDEVTDLVQNQNYKEVTLLGQNIDAYGRDMVPKRKFSDLLRIVGNIEGLKRLRFVTSHPRYMSLGVIDAVAETPSACWNFHIPFQSGSDEILDKMGRGHTRKKYLQIVDRIRQRLPDAAITADVIVGFPGETDEQFEDTLSLMREVKFDSVNTAAYSPRPNTPAADWTNQCSEETKQYRLRQINELNLQHAAERRARMMGRTEVEVLVEERNVKVPTQVMGRTTHGYIVYMDGDIDELRGKLVHVTIDDCQTYYLAGTITKVLED